MDSTSTLDNSFPVSPYKVTVKSGDMLHHTWPTISQKSPDRQDTVVGNISKCTIKSGVDVGVTICEKNQFLFEHDWGITPLRASNTLTAKATVLSITRSLTNTNVTPYPDGVNGSMIGNYFFVL